MIKLFHKYKCRHCGKPYIIIHGHGFNSYLPVEVEIDTEIDSIEKIFDKNLHKSHLINCPKLQAQWETVKKEIARQQQKIKI